MEKIAKKIATRANECCYRSDGYEEEIEKLVLEALTQAKEHGRKEGMEEAAKIAELMEVFEPSISAAIRQAKEKA